MIKSIDDTYVLSPHMEDDGMWFWDWHWLNVSSLNNNVFFVREDTNFFKLMLHVVSLLKRYYAATTGKKICGCILDLCVYMCKTAVVSNCELSLKKLKA